MPCIVTDGIYNTKNWAKPQTRGGKNDVFDLSMPCIGTDGIYNTKHCAKHQTRGGKNAKILSNNKNKVLCNCKALFVCHQILFTGEFIVALSQTNQGVALYITNFIEIAYHPFENEHISFSNEYIIIAKEIQPTVDEMHLR